MVLGALGAAVYTSTTGDVEHPVSLVASEPEIETREIGDAPISAMNEFAETQTGDSCTVINTDDTNAPTTMRLETDEAITGADLPLRETTEQSPVSYRDTRSPGDVADANGPYGTEASPEYEGSPVNFQGSVYDDVTGQDNTANYYYAWEVTGDGIYDSNMFPPPYGPGPGIKGDPDYTHEYCDNHIGKATLEAWDGRSMKYVSNDGKPMNEDSQTWWVGGSYYMTWGMQFEVEEDCEVYELGYYSAYYPYYIYNLRLWKDDGTLLAQVYYPPARQYVWRWYPISPVPLTAGERYRVSVGTRGYNFPGQDNPGSDGVINVMRAVYYYGSPYYFPSTLWQNYAIPQVDIHWRQQYAMPDTLVAEAGVFVDNVAPIPDNPQANPSYGVEGTEVEFTASFTDPGTCDEWEYRWYFCDGTYSPWRTVLKYTGGANVLLLHSLGPAYIDNMVEDIEEACGDYIIGFEQWGFGPLGNGALPPYEYLLQFHVIIIATNFFVPTSRMVDLGDMLADYQDAAGADGGGVITCAASHWGADNAGIGGRWRDDGYSPLGRAYFNYGWYGLGAQNVDPWGVMSGVGDVRAYYKHDISAVSSGAFWTARYTNNRIMAAGKENPVVPNGARNIALNYFPGGYSYIGGLDTTNDWDVQMANSIRAAARRPDPEPKEQPIPLDPVTHIFADDYPTHKTDCDEFCAIVEVRDDDHLAIVPTGDITTVMSQDFSTGVPPAGWVRSGRWGNNWRWSFSSNAGGSAPEAGFLYYYGWGSVDYGRLHSGPIDTSTMQAVDFTFNEYLSHYSGGYRLMVETSTDGVNWVPVYTNLNPSGFTARTTSFSTGVNIGSPTTYFSMTFYGDPWNLNYWYVDSVLVETYPSYQMFGLGTAETSVIICNAYPEIINKPDLIEIHEDKEFVLEGLEIFDLALDQETEEFWYRVIWDDGTQTPWIYKGSMMPPPVKILLYHSLGAEGIGPLHSALASTLPANTIIDEWEFYQYAQGVAPVSFLAQYDVVFCGINWAPFDGYGVGDSLAAYADLGGNVVETVAAFYTTPGWWGIAGRWRDDNYQALGTGGIGMSSTATILDPTHPIVDGDYGVVTSFQTGIPVSMGSETAGTHLIAEYPSYPALAVWDENNPGNPSAGGSRIVGLNAFYYPGYYDAGAFTALCNALWWASSVPMPTPVLDPMYHTYGDNGVYTIDVQVIDDDMNWHWIWGSGAVDPMFNLDPELMDDWISHNYIRVEVQNCNPQIKSKRAYVPVEMDMGCTGTMTVKQTYEMCENEGMTVTLYEGKGPFAFEFDVTCETSYSVEVSGGTFTLSYPTEQDIKSRSMTLDGPGTISNDELLTMLFWYKTLVTCEAKAYDQGSDDLAFIWSWNGDGGEHANDGSGKGRSIYIYDSHGVWTYDSSIINIYSHELDTDEICNPEGPEHGLYMANVPCQRPWELPFPEEDFTHPTNEIRTPEVDSIDVMDRVVFMVALHPQWGFYEGWHFWQYVTIIVVDDDVDDCLPMHEPWNSNHPGSDMDFLAMDYPDYGHP
jgi:hypothetical protein